MELAAGSGSDGPETQSRAHSTTFWSRSISFSCWASGCVARRSISSSLDFLLSGRSLPAWVTGLAFISANLGAIELIG